MNSLIVISSTAAAAALATFGVLYSGTAINPAADVPHSAPTLWLLTTLRDRGVALRARDATPPLDLMAERRVVAGAGNYDAMCAACHLSPGLASSELSRGLYPRPPAFAEKLAPIDPRSAYWVIKHGIKASGMPAWGASVPDNTVWDLVAFLGVLPDLDPDGYSALVAASQGHSHGAPHQSDTDDDDHEHMEGADTHGSVAAPRPPADSLRSRVDAVPDQPAAEPAL